MDPESITFMSALRSESVATARFVLQPLRPDDAQDMVDVLADPHLYNFIGGAPPTLDELRLRFERQATGPSGADEAWLNWIIRRRDDGRALGYIQATLERGDGGWVADLAWLVGSEHQGRGVATEATLGVVAHLRACGVTALRAHILDANVASAAVATHAGLAPTETLDDDGERIYRSPRLSR